MDSKLKCILLDDELPGLTYLKMLCGQIPEIEIVKAFNDSAKFLEEKDSIDFDLCITDIEMPNVTGMELAASLNGKLIIFVTAYKDYAAKAFDIDAVDYLVKPVRMERLQKAVHKAVQLFAAKVEKPSFIQVATDKGKTLLYFHRIALVETAKNDSRDKIVTLDDGSTLRLKNVNFQTLLAALPNPDFCRVNKAEVVAMKVVKVFSNANVTLEILDKGEKPRTVLLSDRYRAEFLSKVNSRLIT